MRLDINDVTSNKTHIITNEGRPFTEHPAGTLKGIGVTHTLKGLQKQVKN
jgi:hypothetical protein